MGGVSGWLVAQPSGYRKQRVPLMETNGFGSSGPGLGNKFPSDSTDPPPPPPEIYLLQATAISAGDTSANWCRDENVWNFVDFSAFIPSS